VSNLDRELAAILRPQQPSTGSAPLVPAPGKAYGHDSRRRAGAGHGAARPGGARDRRSGCAQAGNGSAGVLHVSAQCNTGYHWLPPLIDVFRRTHPAVNASVARGTHDAARRGAARGTAGPRDRDAARQERARSHRPLFADEHAAIVRSITRSRDGHSCRPRISRTKAVAQFGSAAHTPHLDAFIDLLAAKAVPARRHPLRHGRRSRGGRWCAGAVR
jgi:DNA-binding transcriptional LysR family regulator